MRYLWMLVLLLFPVGLFANFDDIVDHEYEESIEFLTEKGVVKGYPDGSFGPDRGVTRAEMLKIVLKTFLTDEDLVSQENCFDDVADERYARYVCYAKKNAIVRGYPDNTFKPDQSVTIAEGVKIALESFDEPVEEGNGANRFQPYFDYVYTNSLFSRSDLTADDIMTRSQMSYLTHQLYLKRTGEKGFVQRSEPADNFSVGCEQASMPATAPTTTTVRGVERSFISAVGEQVRHDTPTKLIVAFHGRTSPNTQVRQYYDLEKAWDEDAIILYPAGLPEAGPSRNRRAPGDANDELRGFEFFDAMLQDISELYCVDMDQVYVVGHSLGAWFTNSLACARGDVIRATGSVGGSTTANDCTGTTAAIIMHNPSDRLASFSGGIAARDQLLEQNMCGSETRAVGPANGNCVEYTECAEGAQVIRCPHTEDYTTWNKSYYPHTWPSFAAEMMWNFFEEHE